MHSRSAILAKNLAALALVLALAACASYGGAGLIPGTSTAADVQAVMGPPAERMSVAGGESVWFYPRQPFGRENYAVTLSPDGRVHSVEQRLTEENLRKLIAGSTTVQEARALLGPPYLATRNDRLQRNIWTYKMYNVAGYEHTLHVQFSDDGLVREVLLLRDWRDDDFFFWGFR